MPTTVTFPGGLPFTFDTRSEAEDFVESVCDAQEKGRCFHATTDDGRVITLLPSGEIVYLPPVE